MQRVIVADTRTTLPTTAKLFGALGLAATGYFNAQLMLPYLPPGTNVQGLSAVATSFGLLLGWRVIGMNPGQGLGRAIHRGLRAAFYLVFWSTLFLGALQMMQQMARGRYDGPGEALFDILAQGLRMGIAVAQLDVIGVLFFGGAVSAMLAEWAWKRWQ